jgi:hypothetical protein
MTAEAEKIGNGAHFNSFSPNEVIDFITYMAMKVDLPQEQVDRLCEIWQQKTASGFFQTLIFTDSAWMNLPQLFHHLLATIFVHTGQSIRQNKYPPDLQAKYMQLIIDIQEWNFLGWNK